MVRRPINAMDRDPVRAPLDTGVRAINAMLTVGRGQRIGLFAALAMGDLACAALLDLAQCGDHIEVSEFIDGLAANGRKDICLQPLQDVLGGALAPGRNPVGMPLAGDFFKSIGGALFQQSFGVVAMLGRVDPLQHQAPRCQALSRASCNVISG